VKLSLRTEYALRALMTLAEAPSQALLRIQAIAERQRIPKRFLEQILNDLRSGGLVESRRGVSGGYRLARPAHTITVREIIQQFEPAGTTAGRAGSATDAATPEEEALRDLWSRASAAMLAVFEKETLASLCQRAAELRRMRGEPMDYVI
jgi:Rrf2 family protein